MKHSMKQINKTKPKKGWIWYLCNHHLKVKKRCSDEISRASLWNFTALSWPLWCVMPLCAGKVELQTGDTASSTAAHCTSSKRWWKERRWLSWHRCCPCCGQHLLPLHCTVRSLSSFFSSRLLHPQSKKKLYCSGIPQCYYQVIQPHSVASPHTVTFH